jgi:hypothetical protein
MKGITKTAGFGAAALSTGVFACLFSHEHGLVLRQAAGASRPLMMTWFGLFLLSGIVLGVLSACEIRKFFGSRAERWMLEGAAAHTGPVPELEEAERVRTSGHPLAPGISASKPFRIPGNGSDC